MNWIVGQRVIAEFEPELGLGIVVKVVTLRTLEVLFPSVELKRTYSAKQAPLKRVVLAIGQKAKSKAGQVLTVKESRENQGLMLYSTIEAVELWEYEIDTIIEDQTPLQQFLSGNWQHPKSFTARKKAWELQSLISKSPVRGFVGPRVSLLPHQFYLASEISHREYPRVLLADEVGLGKTIEAGLIFSALRAKGRAEKVLILTPESLKHQWMAEMYRRFNEMFSVVDEERSEQELASQGASAFRANQKIICSLEMLLDNTERLSEAAEETWDLLIVDEAHHLQWSPTDPSAEWETVQLLGDNARGLLLLTATPEHRGLETEFGLLHLVDPQRFSDFEEFAEQAKTTHVTASLAKAVYQGENSKELVTKLKKQFKDDTDLVSQIDRYADGGDKEPLVKALVDRHGSGRVLLRNRRSRLKGFSERELVAHPLNSAEFNEALGQLKPSKLDSDALFALGMGKPKLVVKEAFPAWLEARCRWLLTLIAELQGEKALLICSSAKRTLELQAWLRQNSGTRIGVFHEGMEVVERDRQAAWFAQKDGAQLLLCSEIGGEGRNFQFCHHLILFDLPSHPDILEQRIGRLDRIGQTETIEIHVPYFEGTPEEVMFVSFRDGLESFTSPWNGGLSETEFQELFTKTFETFIPSSKGYAKRKEALKKLTTKLKKQATELRERQAESVDILIDLNSFDEKKGKAVVADIEAVEKSPAIKNFMESAFDLFGIDTEDLDKTTTRVSAHSLTFVEHFPGLRGDLTISYDRATSLTREEIAFLTMDHPIVQGAMGLLLDGNRGRISACVAENSKAKAGTRRTEPGIYLEFIYVIQTMAPSKLDTGQDLPIHLVSLVFNMEGELINQPIIQEDSVLRPLPAQANPVVLSRVRDALPMIHEQSSRRVNERLASMITEAIQNRKARYHEEIARLEYLRKVNPLVSEKEIDQMKKRLDLGVEAIKNTPVRLDSIRLIILPE